MKKNLLYELAIVLVLGTNACAKVDATALPENVGTGNDAPISATWTAPRAPQNPLIGKDAKLHRSIQDAGDYLLRQQLLNGELSYQVDVMTGERSYAPSPLRLMAGAGSLFTVCRVSGDMKYCDAGDLALHHYLEDLVANPDQFTGLCLYTSGVCQLGGSALTVDAIYKRWLATGSLLLDEYNLLTTTIDLGKFIVSMRKSEGGFYHALDPHNGGGVDPDFSSFDFPGQSLTALVQLYEMTGNEFWLEQARAVNENMIAQPVFEDDAHAVALSLLARSRPLTKAELTYASQIAQNVIAGNVRSLHASNSSASSATKIEALSALAQAFYLSNVKHETLDPEIRAYITFVQARQIPANNCGWELPKTALKNFDGGIFISCEDPSIRIDAVQHWINGVVLFLEYRGMIEG